MAGAPFERVAVDLMGPFEVTSEGNQYIIVVQDYFTKWVIAEALPDKTTQGVADVLLNRWITHYGCPERLHSDQGGEFTSHLISDLCALLRVKKPLLHHITRKVTGWWNGQIRPSRKCYAPMSMKLEMIGKITYPLCSVRTVQYHMIALG